MLTIGLSIIAVIKLMAVHQGVQDIAIFLFLGVFLVLFDHALDILKDYSLLLRLLSATTIFLSLSSLAFSTKLIFHLLLNFLEPLSQVLINLPQFQKLFFEGIPTPYHLFEFFFNFSL